MQEKSPIFEIDDACSQQSVEPENVPFHDRDIEHGNACRRDENIRGYLCNSAQKHFAGISHISTYKRTIQCNQMELCNVK
jgi:hypothetical protein